MDPNIFLPTRGQPIKPATDVCYLCPVRIECAEYAIAHSIKQGIYGGFSEHNRRKIRRARLLARKKGLVTSDIYKGSSEADSTEGFDYDEPSSESFQRAIDRDEEDS